MTSVWRIEVRDANADSHQIKGFRRQFPLTTTPARSLVHNAGYHCRRRIHFPLCLSETHHGETRRLATSVALSGIPALTLLRCVSLSPRFALLLSKGPPGRDCATFQRATQCEAASVSEDIYIHIVIQDVD